MIMTRWPSLLFVISFLIATATQGIEEQQPKVKLSVKKNLDAHGVHWRLVTEDGVVHVWCPNDIRPATAGVVIYLHGYYDSADESWEQYFLAEQFWQSRQNAVFIAPEAPIDDEEDVYWENLDQLLSLVFSRIKQRQPTGPVVAIGHSGAFRNIVCWLDNPRLSEVILLDGLYNNEKEFGDWISDTRSRNRRLILVGVETLEISQRFSRQFGFSVFRDSIPRDYSEFTKAEKDARLLHLTTDYDHMELVHTGEVIPVILRLGPLARLPDKKSSSNPPQLAIGANSKK
jgi:hypothetical protein